MAYNIIKGRVEFSNSSTGSIESLVDIWRNQTVGGTKTFTSNITASGYWDSTRNQKLEPLGTLISSDGANRVLTSDGDGTLTAEQDVLIIPGANAGESSIRFSGFVTGSTFSGSAHGLTGILLNPDHLASENYDGLANRLSASNIVQGVGLQGTTELQVTGGQGITVDTEGVRILTASNGGLAFTGLTLQVDASKTSNKGGGPSNNDEFIIADSSDSDSIKNLTYSQIKTAITDSIASPAITSYTNASNNRIITSVNNSTVNAESDLLFNGLLFQISSSIRVSGAAHVPTFTVLPGGASFGKVGVNVSEPGVQLQVANNTGGAVIGLHRTSSAFYVDGDDIGDIAFVGSAAESILNISSRIRVEADGSEWNNESYPTRMSFWTTPTGSSSPVQRMTINNSGNVGIGGTTAPDHKLAVSGAISASLNISASGFIGDGSLLTGVGGGGIFTEINGSLANTTSSIAIGGTTAPDHKLAVSGAISASSGLRSLDLVLDAGGTGRIGVTGDTDLMTLTANTVSIAGALSGTAGVHISGSDPHVQIGAKRGDTEQGRKIMFNVTPRDTDDKVLMLAQSREDTGNRTIFAVTGSGKVLVGGAHFAGVFNVSGSDNEKLVNVKSDSASDILAITGSGRVGVMKTYPSSSLHVGGNLTVEAATPTLHFSSSTADLGHIGFNDSSNIVVQNNTINKHIVFKTNDASTMREGLRIDGAVPEVVVNQGADSLIDFRVESNNNTHMLFVDGDNEKVGINTDSPLHTLSVTGSTSVSAGITGSGGFHSTGSNPHVAIGDAYGHDASSGMLSIRPSDSNNKVLCLMQSKQGGPNANRIIFGVTGSGQVLVGGAHFGGVLNVSGANNEKLISAKSNTHDPAFYVSGSGDTFQTGFLSASYIKTTTYTVADLPAAAEAGVGARAFVTDASATTFASTVSDGGSNAVPVYSDGTNWKIG